MEFLLSGVGPHAVQVCGPSGKDRREGGVTSSHAPARALSKPAPDSRSCLWGELDISEQPYPGRGVKPQAGLPQPPAPSGDPHIHDRCLQPLHPMFVFRRLRG